MTISNYLEQKWLDMLSGTAFTAPAGTWLQLHTADPTDAGTTSVATNSTRQAASWAAASNPAGTKATSATVSWTSVPAAETYSHWSLWDASTAGNCLWTGALTSSATVAIGDTFQITALTLTLD
jgi:hypothetical protein